MQALIQYLATALNQLRALPAIDQSQSTLTQVFAKQKEAPTYDISTSPPALTHVAASASHSQRNQPMATVTSSTVIPPLEVSSAMQVVGECVGDKRKRSMIADESDGESCAAKPVHRVPPVAAVVETENVASEAPQEAVASTVTPVVAFSSHGALRQHLMGLNEIQARRIKEREERRATPS